MTPQSHPPRLPLVAGSAHPPPGAARLQRIERNLGQGLPSDYVQFLSHANGARPLRNEIAIAGRSFVIERFLPVLDDYANADDGWADVEVVATQLDARIFVDPDAVSVAMIPIAALFAGDFLVLDYRHGRAQPAVGVWDHEASDDFAPSVSVVAPDFASFLDAIAEE